MERLNKQNPMAKDLRQPKYKQQVIPDKKKPKPVRKEKHKGDTHAYRNNQSKNG